MEPGSSSFTSTPAVMCIALTTRVRRAAAPAPWHLGWFSGSTARTGTCSTSRAFTRGSSDVRLEGHTFATNELDSSTYGGFLVPFIAGFVVGRDGISEAEANAWEAEQRELAQRSEFFFFACIQDCFAAMRPWLATG